VHDIADLEDRGIPGVFVATVEFARAAEVQADALGLIPQAVYVSHPIQDRTDEEMIAIADTAIESLLRALVHNDD